MDNICQNLNNVLNGHSKWGIINDRDLLQFLFRESRQYELNITEEKILNHSITVSGVDYIQTRKRISENRQVIHDKLCRSGTITKSMTKQICESGKNYKYLLRAHQRDIRNGIRAILTEKMENGKVRVTNRRYIIDQILNHFNGIVADT